MAQEASLERALVRFAKDMGVASYKFSSPAHAGVPDRIFVAKGHVLFLEIKAPGEVPTPLQMDEMTSMEAHGAFVTWVDTLTDGKEIITMLANGSAMRLHTLTSPGRKYAIKRHL